MTGTPDHFVLICATCKGSQPVAAFREAFEGRLPQGYAIRTVDCMAGCDTPRAVGFQAVNKAQYLFGGIETKAEIAALAAFAQQYHHSPDGWTKATERPLPLLTKTLSRMPCIASGDRP